ncbi:hypothetical protein [Niabella sp.]|uniref:hypothetical protein n=1 Tax=Niabella sp. TaxID=1962976 RepID=UPI002608F03E|nr:hypothetical protein [Niabella sp.]
MQKRRLLYRVFLRDLTGTLTDGQGTIHTEPGKGEIPTPAAAPTRQQIPKPASPYLSAATK